MLFLISKNFRFSLLGSRLKSGSLSGTDMFMDQPGGPAAISRAVLSPAKVLACLRAHQIRDDHVEVCVRHWFIICIDQYCAGFWVSCPNPFRSLYHGPSDRSNHPDVKFVFTCRREPCQGAWTLFEKQKRCANVCPGF